MPKIQTEETPEKLRPYLFHGVDFGPEDGSGQVTGDCPFCGREGKFRLSIATGLWDCKVCRTGTEKGGGNIFTFFRELIQLPVDLSDLGTLRTDRRLLSDDTLKRWGVTKSAITGEWVVPGYGPDGKVNQLYRYAKPAGGSKRILQCTTGVQHQLFGLGIFDRKKPQVYVCEGAWDGMALWEVLRRAKQGEEGLELTGNETTSLLGSANVVGVTNAFKEAWAELFAGKSVVLLPHSDHPKTANGKTFEPSGLVLMRRIARILAAAESPPEEIRVLSWGEKGYDPSLPSGADVRDFIAPRADSSLSERIKLLGKLLARVGPIPPEWLADIGRHAEKGHVGDMDCLECRSWDLLINSWRKALKWTEGLDLAMAVMLACVLSTRALGDQLWVKIIGPPSCLDGDTVIVDPEDGSELTVAERHRIGKKFFVWTNKGESLGVSEALPPEKYPAESMFEVTFASGKKMRVTEGHEFWTGASYVALHTIADALLESASYPLPTISGIGLLARRQGAPRSSQIAQDSLSSCCACSCLDGEQLLPVLDAGRYVPPLRDDAPGYIRTNSYRDDPQEPSRRCIDLRVAPLSNSDVLHLEGQRKPLSEPSLFSNTSESLRYSSPYNEQSSLSSIPSRIEKPSALSSRGSMERNVVQDQPSLGHLIPSLTLPVASPEPGLSKNQLDISLPSLETVQEERDVSQQGASLLLLASDTFEPLETRPALSHSIQQSSCPPDREQQPVDDETLATQQPSFASVRVKEIDLGPSTLTEVDAIVKVEYVGQKEYYDFHVPETQNYWAEGFFNHNCGKSTLCEALSINKEFVMAKSTLKGFHSAYKTDASGEEDNSLIARLYGKTLVTKDGDALLQAPNLGQILSEARDLYDRTSRSSTRNRMDRDYQGVACTWILCGTSSLRELDQSELGERFLDCVIMERIDEELEDDILWRVVNKADRAMSYESDGKLETQHEPELLKAMQLTGGYVSHLRENARALLTEVDNPEEMRRRCISLGKFVAYMRARPSKKQDETAEREFAARLVGQLTRLAKCLAVVLNKKRIDDDVMKRVTRVALDTARGRTLELAKHLFKAGIRGEEAGTLALLNARTVEDERKLLIFLRRIGATETITLVDKGVRSKPRWRLTDRMMRLYQSVMEKVD